MSTLPSHVQQAELFGEGPLSFELDGVVIPDDHSVFKLFPGKSYRLAKVMRETSFAFLDIQGLTTLPGHPLEWDDLDILNVISLDRMMREGESHGVRKRKRSGSEQDKKRLRFLKNLFFTAKRGDLILVPLGEGYSSQIAIGELQDEPGELSRVDFVSNEKEYSTFGRKVRWLHQIWRNQLSSELVKSIHSPTAFHLIKRQSVEEVYVSAYGTFSYDNIYVAKFQSSKEVFSGQDFANIGALFNGLSVIHDNPDIDGGANFYELAHQETGSAVIELRHNSPYSVFVKTVGPLAFSAALIFAGSAEGKQASDMQNVEVTARKVGHADDRCRIQVPADVATTAAGLGVERFQAYCRARQKVEDEATVRPPARLKSPAKKPK